MLKFTSGVRAKLLMIILGLSMGMAIKASALPVVWPGQDADWLSLDLQDPSGDESPGTIDIVGDTTFSAAFYFEDDDHFMARMRLRGDTNNPGNVWQYLFSTDGDPDTIQWVLQYNASGSNNQLEFLPTTVAGTTFGALVFDTNAVFWTGDPSDYARVFIPPSLVEAKNPTLELWRPRQFFHGPGHPS